MQGLSNQKTVVKFEGLNADDLIYKCSFDNQHKNVMGGILQHAVLYIPSKTIVFRVGYCTYAHNLYVVEPKSGLNLTSVISTF